MDQLKRNISLEIELHDKKMLRIRDLKEMLTAKYEEPDPRTAMS